MDRELASHLIEDVIDEGIVMERLVWLKFQCWKRQYVSWK